MPSGAEHRERAYVAASRRTDRPAEARLASAIKASQAHYERTGRHFKITMDVVLGDEMYREEEERRPSRHSSSYAGGAAAYPDRPDLCRKRGQDDRQESFEVRERRVNQMFDLAFPWHRQHCLLQQNQRREREEREDREDHERDARDTRAASMASMASMTSMASVASVASVASMASGTSGSTSAPSTTLSGHKPPTPALSPAPHTPGTTATSAATPAMGYDTIIPSLVSTDAMALSGGGGGGGGLALGQDYAPVFVGPEDHVYLPPGPATAPRKAGTTTQAPLAESLLVSTATTKLPHGPCLWTPADDEPVAADHYGFPAQALLPQTGAGGLHGPLSDRMVGVDENGDYFLALDGNGDYDTSSSSCSNMIMRSFNPSLLSMSSAELDDGGLFAAADPADTTTLGEPTAMLYNYASTSASPTSASDRDYMYATSMAAYAPFPADA